MINSQTFKLNTITERDESEAGKRISWCVTMYMNRCIWTHAQLLNIYSKKKWKKSQIAFLFAMQRLTIEWNSRWESTIARAFADLLWRRQNEACMSALWMPLNDYNKYLTVIMCLHRHWSPANFHTSCHRTSEQINKVCQHFQCKTKMGKSWLVSECRGRWRTLQCTRATVS